ncbi:MAG TPA: molybdenum cofactor biosynthesis protein B [Nitrososphaerales archaeon]|nr:molybdenum cofactor biosynthesis protein B [Nitrososphaerales archaeon]
MKPHEGHRKSAPSEVAVEIVTVSSSRYNKMESGEDYTDEAGDAARDESEKIGFKISSRHLVSDDAEALRTCVRRFLTGNADVLLFTGGTGISRRDITIETASKFFEKELDGFGELLRRTSYPRVGAASALTRATAGVAKGKLIVCMPGSPDAVRTALKVFGSEIPHVLFVARS